MAYNYEYGGESFSRPGASRRSRDIDLRSRDFAPAEHKKISVDSLRHSHYIDRNVGDSQKVNRSISGSKQYAYKLDQIGNKLAERNNLFMSFYKDRNERIKTASKNDSSNLKKSLENYGQLVPDSQRSTMQINDINEVRQIDSRDSRISTRDQMILSNQMRKSGMDLMKLTSNKRGNSKPLEVIYEDPYAQNTNEIDPKQKEILEKYYLQSRRKLRPSQRMMRTPMMTPDNNIKFVDNGSLI